MNINDIIDIYKDDIDGAIDALLTEGISKIQSFRNIEAEPYFEKAYSLSMDRIKKETKKSLINQYEMKFADVFSKYTFSLFFQNTKNPLKFMEVVTKFKKQNDENNKELSKKVMEVVLNDCDTFYQRYCSDLNSCFYMTWSPFSFIIQKVESSDSSLSLQTLIKYLKIVKCCITSVKSSTITDVSCSIMNSFINHYEKEIKNSKKKLRTIDETNFKNFISLLQKLLKGANLKQLEKFESDVFLDFLMSDFLGKQFYALLRFNSFASFNKDLIEQFHQRDVINKLLFKSNLHHELVQQFYIFLSKLFEYDFYDDSIIEQLWTKTFEKSDELEDYFNAWPTLQPSIPSKNQKFFWNLVLTKTPSFSSTFIHTFLIKIAPNCNEKDRIGMIDLLWKSAIESSNSEEFVDVINEYIPNDNEFRDEFIKRCFSLFTKADEESSNSSITNDEDEENGKDDKTIFALKLLIKIWKNVDESKTQEDFDFLLKNCKLTINNAQTFLNLLSTIAKDFMNPLTDEELELIKNQIVDIVSINSIFVFNFIHGLLNTKKGRLFTPHLLFSLLEWMTKLPTVDSVTFKLIRILFEMIHSSMKKNKITDDTTDYFKQAIDLLWDLLYRTDIPDVADFLVKIYMKKCLNGYIEKNSPKSNKKKKKKKNIKNKEKKSNESDSNDNSNSNSDNDNDNSVVELDTSSVNDFINNCFKKLECFGSLTALYFLILEIEDSLNLEKYEIKRNGFNGYKQNLTIHLTKDYIGDVSISEGTSYYSFRKIVRDLIKANDSQITLMVGQNKLDRNHVFKHNEKIKVFFNTFDQEEEENKAKVLNGQQKKNDEKEQDSDSSTSTSSSTSTFSFDVNSFNVEWKKEDLPSQILIKYRNQIKSLLDNDDNLICEAALNLLNYLSIDENEVNLLKTKSDLFDINHPFLFIYRLNLLANLITNKDLDVLTNLFNSDLYSQLINIVFNMDRNSFSKDEYYDLLLDTVVDINKIGCEMTELKKSKKNCMKSLKQDSDSSLASIMNWIIEEEKLKPVNTNRVIDFLVILNDFIQIDKKLFLDHQRFPEFFDLTLFNDDQSVRSTFYKVLTYIKTSRIQEFALSRLSFSRKANCNEYFLLIKRIAKFTEDSKSLFDTLVDSLNDNLFIYKDIKVKTDDQSLIEAARDLCADLANPDFIKGIIDTLEFLFPVVYEKAENENEEEEEENETEKVDESEVIKKLELLFHILVDKIIFNTNRFVYSPSSLLSLVKMILNRFPSLFSPLIQSLTKFSENIGNVKNSYLNLYSSDKKTEKGLNNLGCTCYLNASVQQLFHIKEIRNAIFSYDPGIETTTTKTTTTTNTENTESSNGGGDDKKVDVSGDNEDADNDYISKNWLCQLQLLMANLKYAPLSAIDASGFVSHWKMYGNDTIDPNEQQDAVEFLQILLNRLDESIPGKPISKCIRGQIIHTIKQMNGDFQSQSYEDFITFTLEVINKKNFSESFDAFLEPDIFDGDNKYNVEDIGQIDAARYHAIKKSPEILIFQLKRFDFDLSSLTRKKINSEYQIDKDVDISRLLYKNNNQPCIYELFGIIEHSGGAEGGHYISLIKSNEIQTENENESNSGWRTFNDSRVSNIDENEVLKRATGGVYTRRFYDPVKQTVKTLQSTKIESAYILFYRKKPNKEEEKKKQGKINSEIEEEEEENTENESFTSVNDDEDYPIQFMPEVMLRRFFKNMKNLILRHVLFSNEYIKFMDYISRVDNTSTFSFIYQYTMNTIASSSVNIKSSSIIQTAMKKASTDINFARYILKEKDNLLIERLLNFTDDKQATTTCSLANAAISVVNNANKEKHLYNEDAEFINAIIERKEELINHADKFDFIFRPFFYYLELEDVSFDLSKKYLDFFLDLLESIDKKDREETAKNQRNKLSKYKSTFITSKAESSETNIVMDEAQKKINVSYVKESNQSPLHSIKIDFKNINMTHVFKSILILIEKNDFEKDDKEYYHSIKNRVINRDFMDLWSQSRHHHFNFNSLIVHFLKDDKEMTKKYFDFLCSANGISTENENENDDTNNNDKNVKPSKKQKNKGKSNKSHHHNNNDFVPHVEVKETARKNNQKMTIQKLSAIFANLLTFRDSLTSYRIQWFFEFTEKLKWSQIECGNFLRESSTNIKENYMEIGRLSTFESNLMNKKKDDSKNDVNDKIIVDPYPLFDTNSKYLLNKFLLSDDQFVRGSCIMLIHSIFPSFPKVQISNGNVFSDPTKNPYNNSNNNVNNNSNDVYAVNTVKFVKESESKVGVNVNESESDSSDSDATEHSANHESKSDESSECDKENDKQVVEFVSAQKVCELQALIKLFNILMGMNKEVANKAKETASGLENYQGLKEIPTNSFFELLSWSAFHLIDYSNIINDDQKGSDLKSKLKSDEVVFLTKFDLSTYSSTFSDLIIKFSSFKYNIRCSVIDLLRFIYVVYAKSNTSNEDDQNEFKSKKNSKKKHVIIDQSNSLVYLNALSHLPNSFEMSSFIDNATVYFIPIITPFSDKIESHILKSKFVEMILKTSINNKPSVNTYYQNNNQANNNSNMEENYYTNSGVSNVQKNTGNFGTVIFNFLKKLKVSEKLCSFLWKKKKSSVWGKSSLLLQISKDLIERGGWNTVEFFTEFGCINSIITEFESQNQIQQFSLFTWELMLNVVHAYNRCYILKQSGKETIITSKNNIKISDEEKNEQKVESKKDNQSDEENDDDNESDVKSSESNKSGKNSKKSHNLTKKFVKNFVDLWKANFNFLYIVNGFLTRGNQNYNVIAFKVLKDVLLDGATFSQDLFQIGRKIVTNEPDQFYASIKQQEIREKYAKMSIEIINNSNKIKIKKSDNENDKKSKKNKNVKSSTNLTNSNQNATSNFFENEAKYLIHTKLFNIPLFELFVNEIENEEVKTQLFIEFLSNFNDFSQINEKFESEAVDLLSRNGHKVEKIEKKEDKIVMTKKEKKKFDEHNKKEKDKDVEKIVNNVNKLIEKELLKISKGIDSKDAAEINEKLLVAEKLVSLLNDKLNADAKFVPKKKNEVEKAVNNLDIKRQTKEVYEQLFQVVEKILPRKK